MYQHSLAVRSRPFIPQGQEAAIHHNFIRDNAVMYNDRQHGNTESQIAKNQVLIQTSDCRLMIYHGVKQSRLRSPTLKSGFNELFAILSIPGELLPEDRQERNSLLGEWGFVLSRIPAEAANELNHWLMSASLDVD